MDILPKLCYLFQTLPVTLPVTHMRNLHKAIKAFLWNDKQVRIDHPILTRPKIKGGLALPDLNNYYAEAALTRITDLFHRKENKLWIGLTNSS